MPGLKARLEADLKQAMLARDGFLVETLRGLKAAILSEEVAKNARQAGLQDDAIEQIFVREAKKRDEAAQYFEQGGNQASAEKERAERDIIQGYLPEQLSQADIQILVDSAISEIKPDGIKDLGRVIAAVKARTGNAAEGAVIAKLVKNSLQ